MVPNVNAFIYKYHSPCTSGPNILTMSHKEKKLQTADSTCDADKADIFLSKLIVDFLIKKGAHGIALPNILY